MQRVGYLTAAAAGAALLVLPFGTQAADADPPLPLTVKQRLIELTATPTTPVRGPCVNAEAIRALVGVAPAYSDEIALFAARRLQDRPPRAGEDCSCLIELARAIGAAIPDRAASLSRLIAGQAPMCGGLIIRGIDEPSHGEGGTAIDSRTASGGAAAHDACAAPRTCATPLLRPVTGLIGPTRPGDNS